MFTDHEAMIRQFNEIVQIAAAYNRLSDQEVNALDDITTHDDQLNRSHATSALLKLLKSATRDSEISELMSTIQYIVNK